MLSTDRTRPRTRVAEFLRTESAGGAMLLAATLLALLWANSPWRDSYSTLWSTDVRVEVGGWSIAHDLRHWVNDGLMAVFFFVVGLEIKRELVTGELRDRRRAALPVIAAIGGMAVPALIFVALTAGTDSADGWAIPMATDIAFAVGVLALLGRRAPAPLKVFLLTLAIVDDIGAIAVIALFYSDDIDAVALVWAVALLGGMYALKRYGVRSLAPTMILGVGVWFATLQSGIHATMAGVVLGLLAPARPEVPEGVVARWSQDVADVPTAHELRVMRNLAQQSLSTTERLEHALHPWTSFAVIPLFALANAGVEISSGSVDAAAGSRLALAVVLGLVVGKPVGIVAAVWLATRLKWGSRPPELSWAHIAGVGMLGGIGFTVSLFIAGLAFDADGPGAIAKLAILAASLLASVAGAAVLFVSGRSGGP